MSSDTDQSVDVEEKKLSFFQQLKRRRVFATTAAYLISAWVLIEVAELVLDAFDAPPEWLRFILIASIALAPFVMLLSWFFDITSRGIINTDEQDRKTLASKTAAASSVTSSQYMLSDSAAAAAVLEESAQSDAGENEQEREDGAERRLVSVLKCSISPLPGDSDEEDIETLHRELPAVIERFIDIVKLYEGMPASVEGEQLTAYYGVKVAHEDDTARAFLSAEEMLRFIDIYNQTAEEAGSGLKLGLSVGLHSGFAVVEESADRTADLWVSNIGPVLQTAAGLQLSAALNEIRFSQPVFRVLHGRVDCTPLGELNLGKNAHAKYYSVDLAALARPETTLVADYSLVGRKNEISVLKQSWECAQEGIGQVILVRGEPGIGKTKLLAAISAPIISDPSVRGILLECSAYRVHTPFFPIVQFLRHDILDVDGHTPEQELRQAVQQMLDVHHLDAKELLPMLLAMISPERNQVESELTNEKQKELLMQALLSVLLAQHDHRPGFILVEDLHWADPSTLELLELFISQLSAERCMLLMTCRPTFKSSWTDYSVVSLLTINRLSDQQAMDVITNIDADDLIDDKLAAAIIEKSDGVPLYLEEYSASVLDAVAQGTSSADAILAIPNTLQELLSARLHHLGAAKTLLHLGATIGREFAHSLLLAASELPDHAIPAHLDELMSRELIHRRGLGTQASHIFKHALIQEAAYNSMLKSKREECHLNIALVLEKGFDSAGEHNSEVLAYHYSRAEATEENLDKAISYWLQAASLAAKSYSNQEAHNLLENALECLQRLPENEIRNNRELQILTAQIPALIALRGYATEEMAVTSERALTLCASGVDVQLRFVSLFSVSAYYIVSAQYEKALASTERMRKVAETEPDERDEWKVEAYVMLGLSNFFLGNLAEAEKHLLATLDLYRHEVHSSHAFLFGQDPEALALSYLVSTYFSSGDFVRLEERYVQLQDRAKSRQHPISRSYCYLFGGWKHMNMEDYSKAGTLIDAAIQITGEHGLVNFSNHAAVLSSLHQFELKREPALIQRIDDACIKFRADGSRCLLVSWESYFVRACVQAGMLDKATEIMSRMEADYELSGERWAQSEMIRARALLEEARGDSDKALDSLRASIIAANEIGAFGWALRSACDLSERLNETVPDESRAVLSAALDNISGESRRSLPDRPWRLAAELGISPR